MKVRRPKKRERVTTSELEKLLAARYEPGPWITLFDVGCGTGSKCVRRADAISMGMWPSKGCVLHGFELKVSRSDFLKELRDPSKAFAVSRFCDHWWIVAARGICKPEELPADWGLLEVTETKGSLRMRKKAPTLTPEPMTRTFLASVIRKAHSAP